MKVSVIIPVFNRARVVERTLQSVAAQTHRPLEVILVDNCSTDDTLDVLKQFRAMHQAPDFEVVVTQEPHHTAGAARNTGFDIATGQWIVFFDSDDEMRPRLIQRYVETIERTDGEPDIVLAKAVRLWADGSKRQTPFFTSDIMANHLLHSLLATQRFAVRRDFFAATDLWNINLPQWNDWELGVRLLLEQPRLVFMGGDTDVVIHDSGEQSITGIGFASRAGSWEQVIDLVEMTIRCSTLPDEQRLRYRRLLNYRRMVLAAHYERERRADLARPLCQKAFNALTVSYGNSRRWRWLIAPVIKRLFVRIVKGKRGSARITRWLIK